MWSAPREGNHYLLELVCWKYMAGSDRESDMTIYLHIGMQKTGTTSLQRTMAEKREELKSHGILYPSGTVGLGVQDRDAHHYLAHAIRGRRERHSPDVPFELLDKHVEALHEAAANFVGDVVISSEDFSLFRERGIQKLRLHLPADTKVIVYLRRQDLWADALFGQMMKLGRQMTVETFLGNQRRLLDYSALLEPWAAAFGPENIIVRPYEGAASDDLFRDFCTVIGRASAVVVSPEVRRDNVSLTQKQTELLDLVGNDAARKTARKDFERANVNSRKAEGLQHLSQEQGKALLREYQAGNQEVARRYLGRENLFENLEVALEATREGISYRDLSILIGAVSRSLHREIARLKKLAAKIG